MDVSAHKFWEEVEEIYKDGAKPVHYEYGLNIILAKDALIPLKIMSIEVNRDYHNNFADEIEIKIILESGKHDHILFDQRDSFLVAVWRQMIHEVDGNKADAEIGEEDIEGPKYETFMYRGTLKKHESDTISGNSRLSASAVDSNHFVPKEYSIQVFSPTVDELRHIDVGGNFADIKPGDLLKGLLTWALGQVKTDLPPIVAGVEIVETDNGVKEEVIVIPHVMPAVELSSYMQRYAKGIYEHGIGSYIQDNHWYIFPEYNLKRFTDTKKTLSIYNVPEHRLKGSQRTYIVKDEALKIISTGTNHHDDHSELKRMIEGAGYRYVDSDRVMYDFAKLEPDGETWKATIKRKDNVKEKIYGHRSGADEEGNVNPSLTQLNMVNFSANRITNNHPYEKSKVSHRSGTIMVVSWENAKPELIYPGMPCEYLFMVDEKYLRLEGVVVGQSFIDTLKERGITSSRYMTTGNIIVYLEPKSMATEVEFEEPPESPYAKNEGGNNE